MAAARALLFAALVGKLWGIAGLHVSRPDVSHEAHGFDDLLSLVDEPSVWMYEDSQDSWIFSFGGDRDRPTCSASNELFLEAAASNAQPPMNLDLDERRHALVGTGWGRLRSTKPSKLRFSFRVGSGGSTVQVHIRGRDGNLRFVAHKLGRPEDLMLAARQAGA
mmetsp:Transcript_30135/g.86797  ORF Transcript_30135/g.86797 Transcript_30135/m.86797 type:complete len:164 (-) Transcript_30135:261-752(-)|eukprot:CAMPEP_0176025576 /NCGR_PEP_ID=MMETSP0120_2-20121206/12514_1 /TAXON_ID=160619 /ORGANISM="Kryptoperidinium foliaceum, Strain CCMP 1326" /LENGTH=163 /DNA_ID=CAMNT_0017358761 /DNA_START=23 /DNA_END=514 /DNA_ORIENTATION=-